MYNYINMYIYKLIIIFNLYIFVLNNIILFKFTINKDLTKYYIFSSTVE